MVYNRLPELLFFGETVLNVGSLLEFSGLASIVHPRKQLRTVLHIIYHEKLQSKLSPQYGSPIVGLKSDKPPVPLYCAPEMGTFLN